jgi:hypothetical protein
MSTDTHSLREDLAFMRALVSAGDNYYRGLGEAYLAGGLVYGAQMLMHAGQFLHLLPSDGISALLIGLGPTVVFIPLITWITWRHRRQRASATGRAVATMFASVGAANLALIIVIGTVAWREQSLTTWLIYPCTVFIMQGACWLFAWTLRRRFWLGLVALGWFTAAIAMGVTIQSIGAYLLAAGLGIWLCMALPGWVMTRLGRSGAA